MHINTYALVLRRVRRQLKAKRPSDAILHTYTQAHTHPHTHTRTHKHIHTSPAAYQRGTWCKQRPSGASLAHAHAHTHTYTHTHIPTHTQTHTHTLVLRHVSGQLSASNARAAQVVHTRTRQLRTLNQHNCTPRVAEPRNRPLTKPRNRLPARRVLWVTHVVCRV